MSILFVIILLMIISAIIALEAKNLLSSIVCMGGVGLLLSLSFLFLGSPELAITQIVVEILTLIILIRATINKDLTEVSGHREFFGLAVTVVMVIVFAVIAIQALNNLPEFGHSVIDRIDNTASEYYLSESTGETGINNIVMNILFTFRAFDVLGAAALLFCSIIGAIAILRLKARKEINEPDDTTCVI
jgi:multicomponent Na+:H+ antiporter subunit B